jgi:hypothetical protein
MSYVYLRDPIQEVLFALPLHCKDYIVVIDIYCNN